MKAIVRRCMQALGFFTLSLAAWASDLSEPGEPAEKTRPQEEELGPLRYDDPIPRGRTAGGRPLLDFEHLEFQPFVAGIAFSSEFDADPTLGAGVLLRLPTSLLDGRAGLWGQAAVSHIERDLAFYQPDKEGNFFLFGAGADFEIVHSELVFLRPQLGFLYAWYDDVNQLENGLGIVGGLSLGWHWVKFTRTTYMTFNPQFAYDGEDWILLVSIGMGFDF